MDRRSFDALALRVAHQTSRRAALVSLFGVALLRHDAPSAEATRKAKRRKARKRRQNHRPGKEPQCQNCSLDADRWAEAFAVGINRGESCGAAASAIACWGRLDTPTICGEMKLCCKRECGACPSGARFFCSEDAVRAKQRFFDCMQNTGGTCDHCAEEMHCIGPTDFKPGSGTCSHLTAEGFVIGPC